MNQSFKNAILFCLDVICLSLAFLLMVYVEGKFQYNPIVFNKHLFPFLILSIFWVTFFYIEGFYSIRNQKLSNQLASITRAISINAISTFLFFYFIPSFGISPKTNLVIFSVTTFLLLFIYRRIFYLYFSQSTLKYELLAIGNDSLTDEAKNILDSKPILGMSIVKSLGPKEALNFDFNSTSLKNIKSILVDKRALENNALVKKLLKLIPLNIRIIDLITFVEEISGEIAVESLQGVWLLENFGSRSNKLYFFIKGIFDKFIALLIFILCLPIFIILIPLLLIISGRPLFFSQTRTGLHGNPFTLYKLRTMSIDAEKDGAKWATPGDARVTPIGKILRKTRLDELPQLINVLKGDMSLVGPRPERPEMIIDLERNIPFYNERHLVKPGVTGWAQVNYRYGYTEDDSLKKLRYDLYYVKHKSIWLDIAVILKTIKTVLTGIGH